MLETTSPTEPAPTPTGPSSPLDRRAALLKRGLFPYFDGVRDRLGDMVAIQMRMQQVLPGGNLDRLDTLLRAASGVPEPPAEAADSAVPEELSPPGPSDFGAMVELGQIVRAGFDLPPLDEATAAGLSTQERIELYLDFMTFTAGDGTEGADELEPADRPEGRQVDGAAAGLANLLAVPMASEAESLPGTDLSAPT